MKWRAVGVHHLRRLYPLILENPRIGRMLLKKLVRDTRELVENTGI